MSDAIICTPDGQIQCKSSFADVAQNLVDLFKESFVEKFNEHTHSLDKIIYGYARMPRKEPDRGMIDRELLRRMRRDVRACVDENIRAQMRRQVRHFAQECRSAREARRIKLVTAEVTRQRNIAGGEELDSLGKLFGHARIPYETDAAFRDRLVHKMKGEPNDLSTHPAHADTVYLRSVADIMRRHGSDR